jgi:hypothetical protein
MTRTDGCPSPKLWEYLSFTPLTMLQAYAQAVDFKVVHHFGEGQPFSLCSNRAANLVRGSIAGCCGEAR